MTVVGFNTTANVEATVTTIVDTDDVFTVLRLVGFSLESADIGQAVAQAESKCFEDAVGDITLVDAKWGPSIGPFQIRSLRYPNAFSGADQHRIAFALRDRFFNAKVAFMITKGGTDWTLWSTFKNGTHTQFLGQKPKFQVGHANAAKWWV